ncbi:MAG: hypothetical protein NTY88_03405 [Bacteroidetes bacterium]|nr:hypothetical protein [Bacteroidota bacterium]
MKITFKLFLGFLLFCNTAKSQVPQDSTAWLHHKHVMDSCMRPMKTDLEKTTFLRKYACAVIITGSYPNYWCDNYHKVQDIRWFELPRYFDIFANDSGTAKCGLTSYIFGALLSHYGFESYLYNMSASDGKCTHQTTLVYINDGEKRKLICQDAYYNFIITDDEGNPKDFFEMLTELKSGSTNAVIKSDTAISKMIVPSALFNIDKLPKETTASLMSVSKLKGANTEQNYQLIQYQKSFSTMTKMDPRSKFENECLAGIEKAGYPRDFLYMFLLQLGDLYSKNEVSYLQAKINSILK